MSENVDDENDIQNNLPPIESLDISDIPEKSIALNRLFRRMTYFTRKPIYKKYKQNDRYKGLLLKRGYAFATDGVSVIIKSPKENVTGFADGENLDLDTQVKFSEEHSRIYLGGPVPEKIETENIPTKSALIKDEKNEGFPSVDEINDSWPDSKDELSIEVDAVRLIDLLKALILDDKNKERVLIGFEQKGADNDYEDAENGEALRLANKNGIPLDVIEKTGENGATVEDVKAAIDRGVNIGIDKKTTIEVRSREGNGALAVLKPKWRDD